MRNAKCGLPHISRGGGQTFVVAPIEYPNCSIFQRSFSLIGDRSKEGVFYVRTHVGSSIVPTGGGGAPFLRRRGQSAQSDY